MATSFVEQATLQLNSKAAETRIRNINKLLRDLNKTAQTLKRTLSTLDLGKIATGGAGRKLATLNKQLETTGRAMQQLRRNASRPITINTRYTTTGNQPRPARPGQRGAAGGGAMRLTAGSVILHAAAFSLAASAQRALVNGIAEGFRTQSVATTRSGIQGLSPEDRRGLTRSTRALAYSSSLTPGQSLGIASELLPSAQGNPQIAAQLAAMLEPIIKQQVALGEGFEQATDSAFMFVKAAEQAGRLTDSQGNLDLTRTQKFLDLMQQLQATIGKEFTADFMAGLVRNAGAAKYTISDRQMAIMALTGEEERTRAATGLNRLINQLTGTRIQKDRLSFLKELGLFGFEDVRVGSSGGEDRTETKITSAKDEDLLLSDPSLWIEKNLVPAMERLGFDPNSTPDIRRFAAKTTSDSNATAALISLLSRRQEVGRQADRAMGLSTDAMNAEVDSSGLLALQSARNEFVGALGEASKVLVDEFRPAIALISTGFNGLAALISEASPGQLAGVGVLGTGAAIYAGKKALDFFNPLTGSATLLNGSAAALNTAAAALMRAAGVQGVSGAGGAAAGAAGAAGKAGWLSRATGLLGRVASGAGLVYGATSIMGGGSRIDDDANRAAKLQHYASNTAIEAVTPSLWDNFRNLFASGSDEIVRASDEVSYGWQQAADGATASIEQLMAQQSPYWGESMGAAVHESIITAGDALADRIRGALRTPVQIASGLAASVVGGADRGQMNIGE